MYRPDKPIYFFYKFYTDPQLQFMFIQHVILLICLSVLTTEHSDGTKYFIENLINSLNCTMWFYYVVKL